MSPTIKCGHWKISKRGHILGLHRNLGLELVLMMNGAATWDYDGRLVRLPARHVSFTWPWQWHRALDDYLPSSDLYWIILPLAKCPSAPTNKMRLHSCLGLGANENQSLVNELFKTINPVLKASPLVCQLLPEVVTRLKSNGGRLDFRSRALTIAVLAELQAEAQTAPRNEEEPEARARVEKFLHRLTGACQEDWSLDQMANCCGMARTHFSRWLKELTGDTPVQHLNRLRVERAKHLLRTSKSSITTIAHECGFGSSHYFATVFRNFTGMQPSAIASRR
jgi:AraC-like DNA-binding protein